MWIFLNNAFLSIVADKNRGDKLLVRARVKGDIDRVFPTAEVIEGAGTDYLYRAWIDREAVAKVLYQQAQQIDYGNFKSSVQEDDRHDAYMAVWYAMNRYQQRKAHPPIPTAKLFDDDDDQPTVTRRVTRSYP